MRAVTTMPICPAWGCDYQPAPIFDGGPPFISIPNPQAVLTVQANIPPGSYQLTSRNIQVSNGYLYAECQRINGSWMQSPPLYYLDCQGDITNIDGTLSCSHAAAALAPTPLPPIPATTPLPTIPVNGPLPPGAGYQQVEAPGNPYPYVYIGPGQPPAYGYPSGPSPWSGYTAYAPGDQVNYGGATWTALAPSIGVPPGMQSTNYWSMVGGSPYASPSTLAVRGNASVSVSSSSSFTSFFNQYKWWIVGGLAAVVVVPRMLSRR